MHIEFDRDRCQGNAVCEVYAPEVFKYSFDDGLTVLWPEPPAATVERVRQAVRECPSGALKLVD